MNDTDIYIIIIGLHLLTFCFFMVINQIILKHDITLKKMLIEFTFVWVVAVIAFVVYIGLTFQHSFIIIDWYASIIDVVLLSIVFIVVDCIIYFIGKKKFSKVFK